MTSGGAWSADDTTADAADDADAVPDMEFLEYLGSWEESDEEWMMFAGEDHVPAKRADPAPEGEASVESNDER